MVANHTKLTIVTALVTLFSLIVLLTIIVLVITAPRAEYLPPDFFSRADEALSVPTSATSTIIFVGDIMLSRQVGEFARIRGFDFPFRRVTALSDYDFVVGNFESCLSDTRQFTYTERMRFPVVIDFIPAIKAAGFTHLSLANNHALDCGPDDYWLTRNLFESAGMQTFGHPVLVSDMSLSYVDAGGRRVALIGIHTLYEEPTEAALAQVLASSSAASDVQIVFIHWGNEYELVASPTQRRLATTLVRYGADLIIGHHPHVIQNIELIDGVPVVYSLGNFIFDQYFSTEVQQGLTLALALGESAELTLHPVTSIDERTQPRFMNDEERAILLNELALRSEPTLRAQIASGTIPLQL